MSFKKTIFQRDLDAVEPVSALEPEKDWGYREGDGEFVNEGNDDTNDEVENAEQVAETPKDEVVVTPIAVAIPTPAEVVNTLPIDWKTSLKGVDKYDILKEAGFDDFAINMMKYKEKTGDYTPYLEAKTVDYSKMTDEELLRLDFKKNNPGLSEASLNFKFNKDFKEKYYTDRDDYEEGGDEATYGSEKLRLDSEEKRKQFIAEQEQFKAPEPTPDPDASRKAVELEAKQTQQRNYILESPVTKSLTTTKAITFGEGEGSFTYPIGNLQPVIDNALQAVLNSTDTELTAESLQGFYESLVFAQNPKAFMKASAAHFKAQGIKKVGDEIQGVTPLGQSSANNEQVLTPAQQLWRNGRFT